MNGGGQLGDLQQVVVQTNFGIDGRSSEVDIQVINMVAQRGLKPRGQSTKVVSYDALNDCFELIVERYKGVAEISFHMPRIGVGLGGGSWSIVSALIDITLCAANFSVFVYDLPAARKTGKTK